MYRVYNGTNDIYNPAGGEAYQIESGTLTLGINKAGEFEFTIPPTNPEYNNINLLTSRITVNLNAETLFEGYPVEIGRDWNNNKIVRCAGQLSVLNDGILPGWGIGNTSMSSARTTPYEKFIDVNLQIYNSQVESWKAVVLGECDFHYAKDYLGNDLTGVSAFMSELNYTFPTFWEWLQMPDFLARSPLTNVFNGYIIPKYHGPRYSSESMALTIDIKSASGAYSTQTIEFGRNLLNFEEVANAENISTVVYPVGKYSAGVSNPISVYQSPTGWRLNASDGLCSYNSSYKLVKYAVTAGDKVQIVSDDRFQFQNSASVPAAGTSNRVGSTYGAGTYELTVPDGATYLILSTLISSTSYAVYKETGNATDRYFSIYPGDKFSPNNCSDDYRNFVSASSSILNSFGRRVKSIIYEDVAAPSNLTSAAQKDLQTLVEQALTFSISAIDLSLIDVDYTPIRPGQYFKVKSAPHGINDFFQCSEIALDLLNPEQNNYTFGPALQTLTKFLNSLTALGGRK